ncbi:glycine betaine ABC transporter substrate-binding protein [Methylocella sp.]|uniref:glycine betaine ABC transporter substrate-binding protein n=1 Tax=Methylocella sp. TaxID=1978226 RepID=UPI0037841CFA
MTGARPSRRLVLAGLATGFAAGAQAAAPAPVAVGSKLDLESALLGAMVLLALREAGVPVIDRLRLGPTSLVRQALLAGAIDVCVEYTGNAATFFQQEGDPVWRDAAKGYERAAALDLARNGLVWLSPAPADNSWIIAVPRAPARRHGLTSLADFARRVAAGGRARLAASAEFVESPAGLPAFEAAYGFRLGADQLLVLSGGETIATMKAAADAISGVDAAMAYRTDGALDALGLVALEDPLRSQPVYAPAPVLRAATLEAWPAARAALAPLFAGLDVETLRALNARVAVDGEDPAAVARGHMARRGAP